MKAMEPACFRKFFHSGGMGEESLCHAHCIYNHKWLVMVDFAHGYVADPYWYGSWTKGRTDMQNDYPPYSYVPGGPWPHPKSNPAGHSYGKPEICVNSIEPAKLLESLEMRWAIELFNKGFYWESHEVWESLWHAAGRKGEVADYLKALIKLAAAGVKVREGSRAGVRTHSSRAFQIIENLIQKYGTSFHGIDLSGLAEKIKTVTDNPYIASEADKQKAVVVVFQWAL